MRSRQGFRSQPQLSAVLPARSFLIDGEMITTRVCFRKRISRPDAKGIIC
jgi:hypothetical protein